MLVRFIPACVVAIGMGLLGGYPASEAKVRNGEPLKVSIMPTSEVERVLSTWSGEARAAAHKMIQRCGMPERVSETAIIWSVSDGDTACNPAAAGIPPEDAGSVSRTNGTN